LSLTQKLGERGRFTKVSIRNPATTIVIAIKRGVITGPTIYFADPYAAWQRGLNENTNGLLRQYFPKGMNFREITDKVLALAVKKINHRPRKCLNYPPPHEVYYKELHGAVAT